MVGNNLGCEGWLVFVRRVVQSGRMAGDGSLRT